MTGDLLMRNLWQHSLFVAAGILALAGMRDVAAADAGGAAGDRYTWSAELVAFDANANTMTVKSRVVNHADIEDLSSFKSGDRVMLTWSGLYTAAGIRSITRGTETGFDRFTMPVEFVGSEMDGQYVSFKVAIPSEDAAKIASLEPGQWITATSSHKPSSFADAVAAVRGYTDVS